MKNDLISRQAAIDALDEIRHAFWEIIISSPTIPEYVERHKQVQSVWKLLDKKQKELYALPSAQPEIIYCGDCRYKDDGIDEDGIPFLKCLHGRSYGGTRINDFCSWAERRIDE